MTAGPKDYWDTLAATNWSDRFESFSETELERLLLYTALATGLAHEEFHQQPLRLSVKASPEESYTRVEHAGHTQLRSMTMVFRQLWENGERAEFQSVRALLRKRAREAEGGANTVLLLDLLGKRYKAAARAEMMRHVWADDPMGKPKEVFRARQVINDWLYAGPFHTDPEKVARVQSWSQPAYTYSLAEAIRRVAAVMWELDLIVQGALPPGRSKSIAA